MQSEILEKNPDQQLQVHAVWFRQLAGDSRGAWDSSLLDDSRVTEYWDDRRIVGSWFYEHRNAIGFDHHGPVVWDSSLLFGPEATWDDVPVPLEHFGYTVIARSDGLRTGLTTLWS